MKNRLGYSCAIARAALCLAAFSVITFGAGMVIGGFENHQSGDEVTDLAAFLFCRVISPIFILSSWILGFIAVLRKPDNPIWITMATMVLILSAILFVFYAAWRGSAAFH